VVVDCDGTFWVTEEEGVLLITTVVELVVEVVTVPGPFILADAVPEFKDDAELPPTFSCAAPFVAVPKFPLPDNSPNEAVFEFATPLFCVTSVLPEPPSAAAPLPLPITLT